VKPFAIGELTARLRALLRRQERMPGLLSVGDLQLDPMAVRARCKGRPLPLSLKEFSLLRVLANRPGTVVPRAELLAEVWGPPTLYEATIVDQYVSYVRKKLSAAKASVVLTTVRGVGYRLDEVG